MRRYNVKYRQHAFTLIELLVVISVILIAASIVVVTGRGGSGAALSSSTRIVNSIVQGARGQAILKNQTARLIIYANADRNSASNVADPDKFLRFFGIVYSDPEDPTRWIAATQGTYLPRGVYFDPGLSESATGSNWLANTMTLDFPRSVAMAGGNETYYYYEFQPNGRAGDPNSWLVIRAGTLRPDTSGNLSVEFPESGEEGEMLKAALIIRQAGTATIVTDPSQIN